MSNILDELEKSSMAFLVKLRMQDGFDEALFKGVCELIEQCAIQWKNQDSIPKLFASLSMDSYAAMISSADQYKDEERDRVLMSSDKLANLIRLCLE